MKAIETIYCICMGGSPSLHIYATAMTNATWGVAGEGPEGNCQPKSFSKKSNSPIKQ